jgi:type IV pilus assembly protein PilC
MQYFGYTIQNPINHKKEKGVLTSDDYKSAVEQLKSRGMTVVELVPMKDFLNIRKRIYGAIHGMRKKNIKDFFEQLSFMLSTNLPMYSALLILRDIGADKKLKYLAYPIAESIRKGLPLHEALSKTGCFSQSDIMQIKAGEESGNVPYSLSRLVVQYTRDIDFANKIKAALTYPVIIMVVMFIVLWVLMTMVVPTLAQTLVSMGGELPIITKVVIASSDFMKISTPYIILCVIGVVFAYKKLMENESFGEKADKLKLKIPLIGVVLTKIEMSRFCRNLSAIQKSGIALVPSLTVTASSIKNRYFKNALIKATQLVEISGINLSSALSKTGKFPVIMVQLIEVGISAGQITVTLDKIAEQYEREVDYSIKKMASLMEPIMIMIVSFLVGIVVTSVFLPILSITDTML